MCENSMGMKLRKTEMIQSVEYRLTETPVSLKWLNKAGNRCFPSSSIFD